jgi:hypothetical protein
MECVSDKTVLIYLSHTRQQPSLSPVKAAPKSYWRTATPPDSRRRSNRLLKQSAKARPKCWSSRQMSPAQSRSSSSFRKPSRNLAGSTMQLMELVCPSGPIAKSPMPRMRMGQTDESVIGVLSNNKRSHDTTPEEFDHINSINYRGCWLSSRAAIKQMLTQEPLPTHDGRPGVRGSVVNIASQLGVVGRPAARKSYWH